MSDPVKKTDDAMVVTLTVAELRAIVREEVESMLKTFARGNGEDRFIDAADAATFLGYSKDWIYRNWKKIGGRKVGARGLRFSKRELERWVGSRKIPLPS